MAGYLLHSAANVVQRLLIDLGIGGEHDGSDWPVSVDSERNPPPDNVITVYGTEGRTGTREMIEGSRDENEGIQIRVRAAGYKVGFRKANQIAITLDQGVYRDLVTLEGNVYRVQSINRSGGVLFLRSPDTQLALFTINALICFYDQSEELGDTGTGTP